MSVQDVWKGNRDGAKDAKVASRRLFRSCVEERNAGRDAEEIWAAFAPSRGIQR